MKRKTKIKWSNTDLGGWLWIALSIIFVFVAPIRYKDAIESEKQDYSYDLKIIDMDCDENRKGENADAWIEVIFQEKVREFEINQSECFKYYIGDIIIKKYDRKNKEFYSPGSRLHKAKIFFGITIISLLLSLLPWSYWEYKRNKSKYGY